MAPVSEENIVSAELIDPLEPGDPEGTEGTASSPSQPMMRDLTGQVLAARYQLLDVVGGGGMGTVYRATDTQANREVAVKVLDPRFDPAKDPAFRERFLREARLSTRLSHGNIVEVLDTGESDGVHFIAMELLHGQTLAKLLETEKTLNWERVVKLVRQMCAGLAFAHELGLVHRDLKPANCFVLGEGSTEWVKLLDFGLAKPMLQSGPADEEVTRTSVVMGSPTYMAPEQARGEASVETDIYAMGVMLYRMLSGQVPFVGRTAIDVIVNHIQNPLPWLEEVTPGHTVPIELELVMRRCLEKDAKGRYPSVQALVDAIDAAELDTRRDPAKRAVTIQMAAARRATPAGTTAAPAAPLPPVAPSAPLFASAQRKPGLFGTKAATEPPAPLPASTGGMFAASQRPQSGGRGWMFGLIGALVLGGGGFALWRSSQAPAEAAEPTASGAAAAPVAAADKKGEAPAAAAGANAAPAPAGAPGAAAAPVAAAPAPAPVPAGPVTFRINSIPTGATVKVGSKVMGTTPAIFKIDADDTGEATAELTLELKGYQAITFIATSPGPRFDLTQRLQKGSGGAKGNHAMAPADDDLPVVMPTVASVTKALEKPAPAPVVAKPAEKPAPAPAPAPVVAKPVEKPAPAPVPVKADKGSAAGNTAATALAAAIATPPSAPAEDSAPAPRKVITPTAAPVAAGPTPVAAPPAPAPAPAPAVAAGPVDNTPVSPDRLTTRAKQLSAGEPPKYSDAARAANAEGTAVAKCIATVQGKLENCRLVKPVALMEEAILESLKTRTFAPATSNGQPVASEVSIVLKVQK